MRFYVAYALRSTQCLTSYQAKIVDVQNGFHVIVGLRSQSQVSLGAQTGSPWPCVRASEVHVRPLKVCWLLVRSTSLVPICPLELCINLSWVLSKSCVQLEVRHVKRIPVLMDHRALKEMSTCKAKGSLTTTNLLGVGQYRRLTLKSFAMSRTDPRTYLHVN